MVEVIGLVVVAKVQRYIEGTADGDDDFFALTVCMASTRLTGRDIIRPIDTLDFEGHMFPLLRNSEVATGVDNLWEVDEMVGGHILMIEN